MPFNVYDEHVLPLILERCNDSVYKRSVIKTAEGIRLTYVSKVCCRHSHGRDLYWILKCHVECFDLSTFYVQGRFNRLSLADTSGR